MPVSGGAELGYRNVNREYHSGGDKTINRNHGIPSDK
jgi:hypothetical protein